MRQRYEDCGGGILQYQFQTIEFAVYCSPRDDENYRVFQRALERM
ncbi:MAG: hypothetical protein ACLT1J_02735 [Mediterraneibacter gnavus]